LCSEWAATQDARDFSVTAIEVGDEASGFALDPKVGGASSPRTELRLDRVFASLFGYLVTHGLDASQQELGRRIVDLASQPLVHGADVQTPSGVRAMGQARRAARQ
jgi:hypothetical protein